MIDYSIIYKQMENGKEYTAKDLGVSPASMTAMVRRSMVRISNEVSPKRYVKNPNNISAWICEMVKRYLPKDREFFRVYREGERLGMLCSIKNNIVLDCWYKPYNLDNVVSVKVNGKLYFVDKDNENV